jgi:hypothetical protein
MGPSERPDHGRAYELCDNVCSGHLNGRQPYWHIPVQREAQWHICIEGESVIFFCRRTDLLLLSC